MRTYATHDAPRLRRFDRLAIARASLVERVAQHARGCVLSHALDGVPEILLALARWIVAVVIGERHLLRVRCEALEGLAHEKEERVLDRLDLIAAGIAEVRDRPVRAAGELFV